MNFIQRLEKGDDAYIVWAENYANTTTSVRFWLQKDWYYVSNGTKYPLRLPKNWIIG